MINIFRKKEQQFLEAKQNPEHNHCLILQINILRFVSKVLSMTVYVAE